MFAREKKILSKTLKILALLDYNQSISEEMNGLNMISTVFNVAQNPDDNLVQFEAIRVIYHIIKESDYSLIQKLFANEPMEAIVSTISRCTTFQSLELLLLIVERISKIDVFLPDLINAGIFSILQILKKDRNFAKHRK